jgi:hypothetical protein
MRDGDNSGLKVTRAALFAAAMRRPMLTHLPALTVAAPVLFASDTAMRSNGPESEPDMSALCDEADDAAEETADASALARMPSLSSYLPATLNAVE